MGEDQAFRYLPLAVLLVAHFTADYLGQIGGLTAGKRREPALLAFHAYMVFVLSMALLWPWAGLRALGASLFVGLLHWLVDRAKIRRERTTGPGPGFRPALCLADQAAHLAVCAAAWRLFLADAARPLAAGPGLSTLAYLLLALLLSAGGRLWAWPPFSTPEEAPG